MNLTQLQAKHNVAFYLGVCSDEETPAVILSCNVVAINTWIQYP